jgi:hypothetical protein
VPACGRQGKEGGEMVKPTRFRVTEAVTRAAGSGFEGAQRQSSIQ